jgi:hypothetical protein
LAKKSVKKSKARKVKSPSVKSSKKWHAVPLKSSFMALSIIGFLISAYMVYPVNTDYGLAFLIVFGLMFVASLVSMSKAPILE